MEPGYYWYFPVRNETIPDLQGEPQVVEVFDDSVALCGSDVSSPQPKARGKLMRIRRGESMEPETLEEVVQRIESAVQRMTTDTRPELVRECLEGVALALRMLAANNPSGVLTSTQE